MSRLMPSQKTLNNKLYERYLFDRGVSRIDFLSTTKLKNLSQDDKRLLNEVEHIWKTGDSYYKLASVYYGNPNFWWVIAFYNNKPTEMSLKFGNILYIPQPLDLIISLLNG